MPQCLGCGHAIRQWFAFDLRQIEPLRDSLPEWGLFPLLGCADCGVWMGRHDYRVAEESIELINVAISTREFGEAFGTIPPIPKQPVALEWVKPREVEPDADPDVLLSDEWERPQIGGAPAWTQDPQRVWCWNCRAEMCFVAAMANTEGFEPYVPINNESGYQYHFACGPCRAISVIAQWT